jgi:hypothetical protein
MKVLIDLAKRWLRDIAWFSKMVARRPLYPYQLAPARAIVDSVLHRRGLEFAVMFPRQSGKNETQAQVEAYLLNVYQFSPDSTITKAQPTFDPQGANSVARLLRILDNDWNRGRWWTVNKNKVGFGEAEAGFFSAQPGANVAGVTATRLLECDEAQDVPEAEWEHKFAPMAASKNATVVHWGTAWTSRTLLARTIRQLRQEEARDGIRRVFVVSPDEVAKVNPDFGAYVDREVAKKGRQHPLVKTQYFNEEIDAEGGMFPPARRALMQGSHPRREAPQPGRAYALLLDVAGEDEGAVGGRLDLAVLANPRRDSTVLSVVEVDLSTLADPVLRAPTYRAVQRLAWTGVKHSTLYGPLRALALHWRARYLVADATGVGAGLVSFLERALPPGCVIPFVFNAATKSALGWDFIGLCDSGRWRDYALEPGDKVGANFWRELEHCQYEALPGEGRLLRWGVPDGTRDPATGERVHDDALLSAALATLLDRQPWHADTGPTYIIQAADPLDSMNRGF